MQAVYRGLNSPKHPSLLPKKRAVIDCNRISYLSISSVKYEKKTKVYTSDCTLVTRSQKKNQSVHTALQQSLPVTLTVACHEAKKQFTRINSTNSLMVTSASYGFTRTY